MHELSYRIVSSAALEGSGTEALELLVQVHLLLLGSDKRPSALQTLSLHFGQAHFGRHQLIHEHLVIFV